MIYVEKRFIILADKSHRNGTITRTENFLAPVRAKMLRPSLK